jgi:hypothetical protein
MLHDIATSATRTCVALVAGAIAEHDAAWGRRGVARTRQTLAQGLRARLVAVCACDRRCVVSSDELARVHHMTSCVRRCVSECVYAGGLVRKRLFVSCHQRYLPDTCYRASGPPRLCTCPPGTGCRGSECRRHSFASNRHNTSSRVCSHQSEVRKWSSNVTRAHAHTHVRARTKFGYICYICREITT